MSSSTPFAVGFACTPALELAEVASLKAVRRRLRGPVLFSAKPVEWRTPPELFVTSRLATLVRALECASPPPRNVLAAGFPLMQEAGIPVADALASPDDPLMHVPVELTRKEIAKAMLSPRNAAKRVGQPDLAGTMFADVDGSLTQVLLKLMASAESSAAKSRVKSTYVKWLLTGTGLAAALRALDQAGASDEAVSEAGAWFKTDQGREALRLCGQVGSALKRGGEIDYGQLTAGTRVAAFDLRYLAAASA